MIGKGKARFSMIKDVKEGQLFHLYDAPPCLMKLEDFLIFNSIDYLKPEPMKHQRVKVICSNRDFEPIELTLMHSDFCLVLTCKDSFKKYSECI